jgi:hypothetical protein
MPRPLLLNIIPARKRKYRPGHKVYAESAVTAMSGCYKEKVFSCSRAQIHGIIYTENREPFLHILLNTLYRLLPWISCRFIAVKDKIQYGRYLGMKKLVSVILALVVVLAFATSASAATVLKLAEVHAEGYPTSLADHEFARLVEEKSGGRIKVEVYTGAQLYANESESIEALQLGDLAFTRVSASPVANFVPSINAIQMPYLYKNKAHMWAVLNSDIGQKLLAGIETGVDKDGKTSGLVGLCYYDAGSRSFYLTREVH